MSNHLKTQTSPYLLQHVENPVDWYPWCQEAFEKAHNEDKPVFLSIGYSTCHWCHVMAHESFEDQDIADTLNQAFVPVKVDREERPDIDTIYMTVCQMMNGNGGWPLTILMTPDKKPFFSGTYLPPRSQYGRAGLLELLTHVEQLWKNDRSDLLKLGDTITHYVNADAETAKGTPSLRLLHKGYTELSRRFDSKWGGFGAAPKFPMPHSLSFLLDYAALSGQPEIAGPAEVTLTRMAQGGIFDHIGGGFSRYSTDEIWLVPHFEKMLYDNALLTSAYLKGWKRSKNPLFRLAAEKTADYVLRELTSPEGGFYCAQDADSEGEEGKYYIFTYEEIINVLGEKDGEKFCLIFNITKDGNFEGKNIPNLIKSDSTISHNTDNVHSADTTDEVYVNTAHVDSAGSDNTKFTPSNSEIINDTNIDNLIKQIYRYRKTRTELHRDEKILTSWNGMMITALTEASITLSRPDFLTAAQKADQFIRNNIIDDRGRLHTAFASGKTASAGYLDDYAFYSLSLISLYEATGDIDYLLQSEKLAEQIINLFSDEKNGGFYLTASDAEQLIGRPKETADSALPSGNAAAAQLLTRLAAITGKEIWLSRRDQQLSFMAGAAEDYPPSHCTALHAMLRVLYPSAELLCVTSEEHPENIFRQLIDFINSSETANLTSPVDCANPPDSTVSAGSQDSRSHGRHQPDRLCSTANISLLFKSAENQEQLAEIAPFTADYPIPDKGTKYYLCRQNTCLTPFSSLNELKEYLN